MSLEPEEKAALALGEALYEIRDTAGFRALENYLRDLAIKGAMQGIGDEGEDKKGVKFWRGFVACATQIVTDVDAAIAQAQRLKAELEGAGTALSGVRIGTGFISSEGM